jgi:hypothetical protein
MLQSAPPRANSYYPSSLPLRKSHSVVAIVPGTGIPNNV